jgi:predicted outer membrane repeat protein
MKKMVIAVSVLFFILLVLTPIQAKDNDTDIDLISDAADEGVSQIKTYTDLNDKINNSQEAILTLNESYAYDSGLDNESYIDGISISKNLTIVGENGCYIDGRFIAKGLTIESNCHIVMENITFKNAYSLNDGAAIFIKSNSSLTLKNCTFINNKVYNANGGGIYCCPDTSLDVYDCLFSNNTSIRVSDLEWKEFKRGMGSAITANIGTNLTLNNTVFRKNNAYLATLLIVSLNDLGYNESNLQVRNCLFEDNIAYSTCAIYLDELGRGEITDSVFRNNFANSSSIIILDASPSALVKNCLFEDNYADKGGAIHVKVFEYTYKSNVSIEDCNFTRNRASEDGGAIFSKYGLTRISNCNFIENTAGESGGAIYTKLGELNITNSYFYGNSAQYGGAMVINDDKCRVDNCVFVKNAASVRGGAIYSKIEDVSSSNCRYEGNTAPSGGENVYGTFVGEYTVINSYFGDIELKVKLTSPWNMPLSQTIRLYFSGEKEYRTDLLTTDSNGIVSLKVPIDMKRGEYTVSMKIASGVCHNNQTITVVKAPSKLEVSPLTATYDSGKLLKITVVNSKTNRGVSAAKLTLKVYTGKTFVTYTLKCDGNGVATFDTSGLSGGKHTIVISSANGNIKVSDKKSWIMINKAGAKIEAPKSVKKSSKLKVTVKNKASKRLIKNTQFKLKLDTGKTVSVKTNSKGVFKVSTKKLSRGTHKFRLTLKNSNYDINKKFSVKIKK